MEITGLSGSVVDGNQQTEFTSSPWPFLNAIHRLTLANMQLLSFSSAAVDGGVRATSATNALQFQSHLLQGMTENYARFMSELNADAVTAFAGTRGMLVSIAADE